MDEKTEETWLLDGITVVSMAEQYPGPYCTLLLADMGADVILVERPGGGDPSRQFPSFFSSLNRNKRSVALDLKAPAASDVLARLSRHADVFVEGFRPGTIERLGLGYDSLSAQNSAIVYCSISGFGQTGPYRDRPAHDITYQGMAGLLHGQTDDAQSRHDSGLAIGDLSSGMFAALAIVSALLARTQTGRGTYIDVSMTDGLVSWMTTQLVPVLNGRKREALVRDPAYGVFRAADRRLLTLSIAHEDHFWQRLCDVLGWSDARDLARSERAVRYADLSRRLANALESRPRDEWVNLLTDSGVPAGPVLSLAEVADDPGMRSRGLISEVQRPEGTTMQYVSQPVKFRGYRTGIRRDAPALGEHTAEVLRSLGYSQQDIHDLREAGAIM